MIIKNKIKIAAFLLTVTMFSGTATAFATPSSYSNSKINGVDVKSVTIDMSNPNISPIIVSANNQMNSSASLATMAKSTGAFAAINGTYFEAYNGVPVPWGTIIKNGKVLHISNGGSVMGITSDGDFLVDRLSFTFKGYINEEYKAIPWRINHPSTETDAITIFTPEYGTTVKVIPGAKGVIVRNGIATQITPTDFIVPSDGFAIVYNSSVANLVDERYKIGDVVRYEVIINTTFTDSYEWDNVKVALGAGPSLIIKGNMTADGTAEGFFEAKINTGSAARSFIGATSGGKIVIGSMGSATLKQAAEACKQMGLVNAMCLDGGGSVALYYPSAGISTAGRNINNSLGFIETKGEIARPTSSRVLIDGENIAFEAYNINGNNYFKLRDVALAINGTQKQFGVEWDAVKNAINLRSNASYNAVGGELAQGNVNIKSGKSTTSKIYKDSSEVKLTAYNIEGNNYFKLRDLAEEFNIGVTWDESSKTVGVDTSIGYMAD